MRRRIVMMLLVVLALSVTGCSRLAGFVDPPPDQSCTAFGCHPKQGNLIEELGGIILFGVLIAGGIAVVVRRMSGD